MNAGAEDSGAKAAKDDAKRDLGLAGTLPAEEASVDGPARSDPSFYDIADAAERDRVFEALFQVPAEPQRLGRYVVLGTLGRGAMGTVLEAFDRTLDRRVAVKVLHHELGQRHRARLIREAQALAKLSHPNVVQVYEVGESDEGQVFIAMELVRGRSLREWLRQDPRPGWRACVQVYLQAGEGLAASHAEGLVHRDFKPDNAVIDDKGRVRVLDFGLVRQAEDVEQSEPGDANDHTTTAVTNIDDPLLIESLTRTGTVLGTPAYMPLEQMEGQEADVRSDQYSLCASLYEALYGERPFEGDSLHALMLALAAGKVRPAPKATLVPEVLRRVVLRGLATDPTQRWPSTEALVAELRRLLAPRRRAWWALGLTAGLGALGLGLWQYAEVGFRCDGARAWLDGTWDEARKQEMKSAILDTGVSYAADTWERVEPRLDEYAEAWVAKHTEVCEATSVRQEQSAEVMDLRMECLRGRRIALREAVGVLVEADPKRVEKAVELVSSLPGLSRCDDVEALRVELPPPEDPEVAAQVEALREQLAHLASLRSVGAYDEALPQVEAVVEQARTLAHAPLLAEALLEQSRARERLARYAEAEQDAEQAYLLAAEHGHEEAEARAARQLTYVVGYREAKHEAGLQWGKTALALARGPHLDPVLEADSLNDVGSVLRSQGRLDEALDHHLRALAIKEQLLGPRHVAVAVSCNNIGLVLHDRGEQEAALTYLQRALAIREEVLAPGHPEVASLLTNIGNVWTTQGKLEEALVHYQRAMAIHEANLGPRHPNIATDLNNIGEAFRLQGKPAEALVHHRRALAIWEATPARRDLNVAFSLTNIGNVLRIQGKPKEALEHFQRASAMLEGALSPDHPNLAVALHNIGDTLGDLGEPEAALPYERRALEILEASVGPQHPNVAIPLIGMAKAELAKHDIEAARAHAERAVSIGAAGEVFPALLADGRFVLARALWPERGQEARSLAEQARDGFVELGALGQENVAEIQAWLAEHRLP